MAQLILTDEEKAAATWLELPDETVGKVVKNTALKFLEADKEMERMGCMSACLILTGMMHDANAETTTIELKGTSTSAHPTGDWKITIERTAPPQA